jgi:hypothetical protein
MGGKPKVRRAMFEAGSPSHRQLAAAAGVSHWIVWKALTNRVDAEDAGAICRALGEMANLSAAERREVLAELVNFPGEREPLASRVSSEDPKILLWEAARKHRRGHHDTGE